MEKNVVNDANCHVIKLPSKNACLSCHAKGTSLNMTASLFIIIVIISDNFRENQNFYILSKTKVICKKKSKCHCRNKICFCRNFSIQIQVDATQ